VWWPKLTKLFEDEFASHNTTSVTREGLFHHVATTLAANVTVLEEERAPSRGNSLFLPGIRPAHRTLHPAGIQETDRADDDARRRNNAAPPSAFMHHNLGGLEKPALDPPPDRRASALEPPTAEDFSRGSPVKETREKNAASRCAIGEAAWDMFSRSHEILNKLH